MRKTIHVGYEIGTGKSVDIPLLNLAITGQTQAAGKTTALEALASRCDARVLTFVTKRGEKAFAAGNRVQPYFRDRADWQFVMGLIEAMMQEKNKFLRQYIIPICRSTRSLNDVQREVRKKTSGIYVEIDAYLDIVLSELGKVKLAAGLELAPGLNVMDLSDFTTPLQMLFVGAAIDWINDRERDTVVVIPEAWEFAPEGKGTPVKNSAIALVRKGSGIGNRIWVDSQDMAGVSKVILRGCPVWLIGVQREINEIRRNIANIPTAKPKPTDVALLGLGQFFVCHGATVVKTYVQPAWMTADEAQAHSKGIHGVTAAGAVKRAANFSGVNHDKPPGGWLEQKFKQEEPEVDQATADRLTAENEGLKRALEQAEQTGHARGFAEAAQQTANGFYAIRDIFASRLRTLAAEIGDATLSSTVPSATGAMLRRLEPEPQGKPADAPKPSPRTSAAGEGPKTHRASPAAPSATVPGDNPGLKSGERAMLYALVRAHSVPVPAKLWGAAVGRSPVSGPWHVAVRNLKDAGFIVDAGSGFLPSDAGIKESGFKPEGMKTTVDLFGLWRVEIAVTVGDAPMQLLRALAEHRIWALTPEQWGLLAKRSWKSGPWHIAVKALREWDLIADGSPVRITPEGLAVAGDLDQNKQTAEAIRLARRELLSSAAARLYDALEDPMTKQELADKLNLSSKSGPWHSSVKELRESGLVDETGGKLHTSEEALVRC